MAKAKIGEGHAAAMGRLGLQELRNAFNPSRESVADRDFGLYGSATQGEIADAREGSGKESLSMADLRADAEKVKESGKDAGKEMDDRKRDQGGPEI